MNFTAFHRRLRKKRYPGRGCQGKPLAEENKAQWEQAETTRAKTLTDRQGKDVKV